MKITEEIKTYRILENNRINKTKNGLVEKMSKIDKPITWLRKNNIRNEYGDITTKLIEIKKNVTIFR